MPKQTFLNLPEEKQSAIREYCLDLFARRKYEEITIRDIVKGLDISIGSFYKYFTDKDDLYLHLMVITEQKYIRKQKEAYQGASQFQTPLTAEEVFTPTELAFDLTWYDVPESVWHKFYFSALGDDFNPILLEELEALRNDNLLREDIDIGLIYYMYLTSMFNIMNYFRSRNIVDNRERMKIKNMYFRNILLYGILGQENAPSVMPDFESGLGRKN